MIAPLQNIGPTLARTQNTQRSEQNGQVSENVVARANPCGSHVGIALTVCPKERERNSICDESSEADSAHRNGAWKRSVQGVPDQFR
jgi:hypothetical protein